MSFDINNVIVFGFSKLGEQTLHSLSHEGFCVRLLDTDEIAVNKAKERGFDAYIVDVLDDEALKEQGIGTHVQALFMMFNDDNLNLYTILSCRTLSPKVMIVSATNDDESAHKLRLAGADKVINPYELGAKRIYEIMKKPHVDFFINTLLLSSRHDLGEDDIRLHEYILPDNSLIHSLPFIRLEFLTQFNLILLGVIDHEVSEEVIFHTKSKDYDLTPGDTLILLGHKGDLKRFSLYLQGNEHG